MTEPLLSGTRAPRLFTLLLGAVLVAAAACTEQLDVAGPCPAGLCPEQDITVENLTLETITLEATVTGIPAPGQEPLLLVAREGDTLDTRAVYRFDFMQRGDIEPGTGDTVVFAQLFDPELVIVQHRVASDLPETATLGAYHVHLAGDDSGTTALLPLFTPERRLGSIMLEPPAEGDTAAVDTLVIPLDSAALREILVRAERVRIGIAIEDTDFGRVTLSPVEAAIRFRTSPDTNELRLITNLGSATPEGNPVLRRDLQSFMIIAAGTPPPAGPVIAVGGLPSRRALLRYTLPPALDTATVLRATLILQQAPVAGYTVRDSLPLGMLAITTGNVITDLQRQVQLAGNPTSPFSGRFIFPQTPRMLVPGGSDTVSLSLTELLVAQARLGRPGLPPFVVLWSFDEGVSPVQVQFYSSDAAPELRPQLEVSFVRPVNFILP